MRNGKPTPTCWYLDRSGFRPLVQRPWSFPTRAKECRYDIASHCSFICATGVALGLLPVSACQEQPKAA